MNEKIYKVGAVSYQGERNYICNEKFHGSFAIMATDAQI